MAQPISQIFFKKNLPLLSKKGRDESSLFIVEGEKFAAEISSEWSISYFIVSDEFFQEHDLSVYENKASVYIAPDHLYKKLSGTVTPQGVMAVCEKKSFCLENVIRDGCLLLLCEQLSDPGNVGALIRTSDAANASGIILTQGSADLYSPKVIRASAGSVFHIPCVEEADALYTVRFLKSMGIVIAAAHLKGNVSPYSMNMRQSCCILIGNEARGLSPEITEQADILLKLPMNPRAESLNAAAAGSILLYEAVRQRGL